MVNRYENGMLQKHCSRKLIIWTLLLTMWYLHGDVLTVNDAGPAVEFSDGMNQVRSPPPLLGEHTDEVLSEYLTADEIARLRAKKVIA